MASDPVRFDGFPSSTHDSEVRDGFPSTHIMDSTPKCEKYGIYAYFRISENSERLRESDPGVQIVPASRSPSELSAHQMGPPLAGTTRLKEESIHSMPGSSALAIEGQEQLSISDRALLRKYGLSGQQQETIREPDTHDGTIPVVQRVDGHPPQGHLSLYDRMLLRKYSVSGNASIPSDYSSLSSIPPTAPPVESTKKRRRFFKKANAGQRNEERSWSSSGSALPADFRPRSQSHLFELEPLFLILLRVLSLPTSRYCIIRCSEMELCHWVICRNLFHWRHLRADQRTGCKLQRLLSQILLRLCLLLHFAEILNIELQSKNQFWISLLSPQT